MRDLPPMLMLFVRSGGDVAKPTTIPFIERFGGPLIAIGLTLGSVGWGYGFYGDFFGRFGTDHEVSTDHEAPGDCIRITPPTSSGLLDIMHTSTGQEFSARLIVGCNAKGQGVPK